jgi:hypothetical protein
MQKRAVSELIDVEQSLLTVLLGYPRPKTHSQVRRMGGTPGKATEKEAGIELVAAKVEVEHYVHGIAAPVRRQLRHLIDAQHRSRC